IVVRMASFHDKLETEQVSLFLGPNFVVSFKEGNSPCLEHVCDRLRRAVGRARQLGADYLAYSLLDAVVDSYFPVLEQYGEHIENLEDKIINNPNRSTMMLIHQVKRDLLLLRRSIWPFRDAINSL